LLADDRKEGTSSCGESHLEKEQEKRARKETLKKEQASKVGGKHKESDFMGGVGAAAWRVRKKIRKGDGGWGGWRS